MTKYIYTLDFVSEEECKQVVKELRLLRKLNNESKRFVVKHNREDSHKIYIYKGSFDLSFKEFDPLSLNQIENIIKNAKNQEKKLFIKTLFWSGRRISEVLGKWGIRPMDILEQSNIIKFIILKKKEEKRNENRRRIFVEASVIKNLLRYVKINHIDNKQKIFPKSRQWGWKAIKDAAKDAGIKQRVWPHLLRHSYGALLARQSDTPNDLLDIQHQLQHKSSEMTNYYIRHFNKKGVSKLVRRLKGGNNNKEKSN